MATRRGYSVDVGTQHLRPRQRRADRVVRLLGEYPGLRTSQRADRCAISDPVRGAKVGCPGASHPTMAAFDRLMTRRSVALGFAASSPRWFELLRPKPSL